MLHADSILPALQGFTPRESLYVLLMEEMQLTPARTVADNLRKMILMLRSSRAITEGDEDLLWRAQEWLAGGTSLTRK